MRGFATSGGVVLPVLLRAARTGHKASGGGGGGGGFGGFVCLRRSRATTRRAIDMARIDADGSRPSNDSSRAEAIFTLAGRPAGLSSVCYASGTIPASTRASYTFTRPVYGATQSPLALGSLVSYTPLARLRSE